MKNFLFLLIFIFTLSFGYASQEDCSAPQGTGGIDLNQEGGIYLPSQGDLKVLVVFVRFKDDTESHDNWPVDDDPYNYSTFIDPNLQTNSSHFVNLTNYFDDMSLGLFNVYGEVISVETPKNRSFYGSPMPNRALANKDVLQNVVDPLINFSNYDNWDYNSDYSHTNQPDGTVDMVVMVWRGMFLMRLGVGKPR